MYEIIPTFVVIAAFFLGFQINGHFRNRKSNDRAGAVGVTEENDWIA